MNRDLWTDSLYKAWCPPWECPVCRTGRAVLRSDSLVFEETVESRRDQDEEYWGPENIEYIFTAWAECSNVGCKQAFAIAGTGGIEQGFNSSDEEHTWEERFTPTQILPAPKMIDLPRLCPKPVEECFKSAFSLYWSDPEACAGKIRAALEALLTHLGIATDDTSDPKKPKRLSLHRRIELLQKTTNVQATPLMAIKWMGNTGSHGGTVSRRDTLDALELLEHLLPELLEKKSEHLKTLEARLLKRHLP